MSIDLNEALEMLVENLSKSIKPEQQSYMQDAAEISQKINDELININSIFKGSVYKWDQTCKSYFLEKKIGKTDVVSSFVCQRLFSLFTLNTHQKALIHSIPQTRELFSAYT